MRKKIFIAFVRFFGIAHAGVLTHGPEAAAIHGGLHAARKRELAGITCVRIVIPAFKIGRRIKRLGRDVFELLLGVAFDFGVLGHVQSYGL